VSAPVPARFLDECLDLAQEIAEGESALGALRHRRDAMIVTLCSAGLSTRKVGKLFGITSPRVTQIMNAARRVA
jgi:hypothetical protein